MSSQRRSSSWAGRRLGLALLAGLLLIGGAELAEAQEPTRTRGGGGVLATMTPAPTPTGAPLPPGGQKAQSSSSTAPLPGWVPQLQVCGVGLLALLAGAGVVYFVFFGKSRTELARERQLDAYRKKEREDLTNKIYLKKQLTAETAAYHRMRQQVAEERDSEFIAFEGYERYMGPYSTDLAAFIVDKLHGEASVKTTCKLAAQYVQVPWRFTADWLKYSRFSLEHPVVLVFRDGRQPAEYALQHLLKPKLEGYSARVRWVLKPIDVKDYGPGGLWPNVRLIRYFMSAAGRRFVADDTRPHEGYTPGHPAKTLPKLTSDSLETP